MPPPALPHIDFPISVNALMESTIGLCATELIKPQRLWKAFSRVKLATAEWIDRCNQRRLHGETGHIPPAEGEAHHDTEIMKPQVIDTF